MDAVREDHHKKLKTTKSHSSIALLLFKNIVQTVATIKSGNNTSEARSLASQCFKDLMVFLIKKSNKGIFPYIPELNVWCGMTMMG